MPPPPSQKGTGKKGRIGQPRSRNTTPSLVSKDPPAPETDLGETAYLELPIQSFRTSDDGVDHYSLSIPNSKELELLLDRLKRLVDIVETRSTVCDKGMRMVAQIRKDRLDEIDNERRDEERRERIKRELADEEERGRNKANKIKKKRDAAKEERPLTHGAHGLAPQDGSNLGMLIWPKL
jgi:transcriptional adapter 3